MLPALLGASREATKSCSQCQHPGAPWFGREGSLPHPWLGGGLGGLGLAESVPPSEMPANPISSFAFRTQQVEICDDLVLA